MSRIWVRDMNYAIIPAAGARPRHWLEDPPRPINGTYDDHCHQILNHNFLTNLLHGTAPNDAGTPVPADFNWYYLNSIRTVATYFAGRMDTVPVAPNDLLRLASFTPGDIFVGKSTLEAIAKESDADRITMGELYTYEHAGSLARYEHYVDLFEHFQRTLRWACMPFVGLRKDIATDAAVSRPTPTDLTNHLSGAAGRAAVGPLNYLGVLRLRQRVPDEAAALLFALENRFIDPLSPVERDSGRTFDSQSMSKSRAGDLDVGTKGGGNSYKCENGVCRSAAPTDYCTNDTC